MTTNYEMPVDSDVESLLINRLRREIARRGSLDWSAARLAMWGGQHDRRDARFHNERIQRWIAAGVFVSVEQPDGDSKVGNPA